MQALENIEQKEQKKGIGKERIKNGQVRITVT